MNPASSDQALDSWIRQIYAAHTKLADPGRSRSAMEMDQVINIVNTTNKNSRMIGAPAPNTCAKGACDLAVAGSKSEQEMHRVAVSLINNFQATSVTTTAVPRSSCNLQSTSENSSALHILSSAFHNGQRKTAAEAGGLCRSAGAVKVKKKRVRPSRRVPTTMVKTDISNFKAMVEQFTGIPPTQESSTAAPSAVLASSLQSTSSVSSPSFSKPLPHPVLSKFSNSSSGAAASTTAHLK